jgi:mono/diheme cytochrome c family protein
VARAGAEVITQAGCLACHRLATTGNDGPGPPLDAVGARMAPRAIRRALIHAIAPMPSYRHLAPRRLRALVAYLSQLS